MANYTENFGLKKPEPEDFYDVEDFNGNMDILDSKLKELSSNEVLENAVESVKNEVEDLKESVGSVADTGGTSTTGSIFAKLNKLLTDWTTTRASRIDSIYTNTTTNNTASTTGTLSQKLSSIISTISSILADTNSIDSKIGTTTDTGVTTTSGSVFGKLNKLLTDWTSTRASRVDTIYNNTLTSSTSSSTGTLSQKLNYIKALIGTSSDSGSTTLFGLIKNLSSRGTIKGVQYGVINFKSNIITIPLNEINPEKSIVLINGVVAYSSSSMAGVYNNPYIESLTSTELKLSIIKYQDGAAGGMVSWQVIEFI